MAEKKSKLDEVLDPEIISTPEPEPEPTPEPEPENQIYEMGVWRGLPQWKCKKCPWDTLAGESEMLLHWAAKHAPPPPPRPTILIPGVND